MASDAPMTDLSKLAAGSNVPPPDFSEGNGMFSGCCHVCGMSHGTRTYFAICAPRSRIRKRYLKETLA